MYSQLILKIIVFLLPTQLGLHFWPSFSRAASIRIDYLSPTLYLTDIFILIYIALSFRATTRNLYKFIPIAFFIILNTFFSISPLNTLFWWLRTLLYLLFTISIKLNHVKLKDILRPLTYSAVLVISVQILQFIKQGSLDGLFYYLGERHFTFDTPNLARITLFGRNFLRVPSLFSHPNSLAGHLLLLFVLIPTPIIKILIFFGLLLTFSKSAIFALAIYLLFSKHSKSLIILSIIFSFILLVSSTIYDRQSTIQTPYSLQSRLDLLQSTHQIIAQSPLLGVGLGNFIPALAQELPGSHLTTQHLQPVHNILLLLLTELGFPIFIFLVYLYIKCTIYHVPSNKSVLALICLTGLFDHYWLTLPQNRLLLSLLLGIL